MLLSEGEFIGASIPQHLFLKSVTCKQCQHSARFTVLIAHMGAEGLYRKVPLCKDHWEQAIKEDASEIREYPPKAVKLVLLQKVDREKAG